MMNRFIQVGTAFGALFLVAGCLGPNPGVGPNGELPVIARPFDTGYDDSPLTSNPAVAYDPDGCQLWLIDDGVEGVAGRRRDPNSGLPVCNNLYAPGSVVREYRANDVPDWIPYPPYG